MSSPTHRPTVIDQRLRLGIGFLDADRSGLVARLAALGSTLRSFPDRHVDLELSVTDRDGVDQQVTLQCWVSRIPRLRQLAISSARELPVALNEVRDELIRQVEDARLRAHLADALGGGLPPRRWPTGTVTRLRLRGGSGGHTDHAELPPQAAGLDRHPPRRRPLRRRRVATSRGRRVHRR